MSLVRIVVLAFGAVYVLVGLLGFLGDPFVTGASHDSMPSAEGDLLGLLHLGTAAILLGVAFINAEPDADVGRA